MLVCGRACVRVHARAHAQSVHTRMLARPCVWAAMRVGYAFAQLLCGQS